MTKKKKVQAGIIAKRDAAGNFLPAKPIYREVEEAEISKTTGMTKQEDQCCDLFANAMVRYIKECRKKGIDPFKQK